MDLKIEDLELNWKISDKKIDILFSDLDFSKKCLNWDYLGSDEVKNQISQIIIAIQEKIWTPKNFENEIVLLKLNKEVSDFFIKLVSVRNTKWKLNEFDTILKKIIDKIFSKEWIKKSGKDVENIVKCIEKLKENWMTKKKVYFYFDEILIKKSFFEKIKSIF